MPHFQLHSTVNLLYVAAGGCRDPGQGPAAQPAAQGASSAGTGGAGQARSRRCHTGWVLVVYCQKAGSCVYDAHRAGEPEVGSEDPSY